MSTKNTEKTTKKIDAKIFARIKSKFKEYWKVLFCLIGIYIVVYLIWFFSATKLSEYLRNKDTTKVDGKIWTKRSRNLAILVAILQGSFFCLDGFVTSLLKAPFNQMCYAINKTDGLPDKEKDYIITKATESNEHCKETLKKFGMLSISGDLIRIFIQADNLLDTNKNGDYAALLTISYLIPLTFACYSIWAINRELKKIEKNLVAFNGKKY